MHERDCAVSEMMWHAKELEHKGALVGVSVVATHNLLLLLRHALACTCKPQDDESTFTVKYWECVKQIPNTFCPASAPTGGMY